MTPPVFWAAGVLVAGSTVVLEGPQGHHGATVRRLRVGERAVLTDGEGTSADAVVTEVGRDRLTVVVQRVSVATRPTPVLVVVQALPKAERGQTAVATLTEVGVDVIVPWAAARCVAQWDRPGRSGSPRALERWRGTAAEAAKQARRSHWPRVADLATTAAVAARLQAASLAVVLHEGGTLPLARATVPSEGEVVVVVGPEGGLDDSELAVFAAAGAATYRLGDSILRTSTAGTVAAAVLLARTTRWAREPGAWRSGPDDSALTTLP